MASLISYEGLKRPIQLDPQGLVDNIMRRRTPTRAHHMELFHDGEIATAIAQRFGLFDTSGDRGTPEYWRRQDMAVRRFLGFDYVGVGVGGLYMNFNWQNVPDTAELPRANGRGYLNEHRGPITTWEEFEKFPWPKLPTAGESTVDLEWYCKNLPDDMCIVGMAGGHFAEYLTWAMGYETLCYALYDQRDLVEAIAARLREMFTAALRLTLQFDRVKMIWASDDMGFKTQLLIGPDEARKYFLPGHRELAAMSHAAGRPYLLHACGNLTDIIPDLIDMGVDAKHSFEDTIEDVRNVKHTYGRQMAMIGGIDVDFLCRSDEQAIRRRVRETLDICSPGGGYCLGTGNSVANYIPLDHYLAMVDEGRLWGQ